MSPMQYSKHNNRSDSKLVQAPSNCIAGRPKTVFCFGSLVILDVMCRYLSLFLLYINIKNR